MATSILNKNYKTGNLVGIRRTLLVQLVPFVLMLVVGSWLTLMAGQVIDQQRREVVKSPVFEEILVNRF